MALVLAGALLAAGCGGSAGSKPTAAAEGAKSAAPASAVPTDPKGGGIAVLTIQGAGFGAPLTVNPGEPVKVVNKQAVAETVTSGTAFDVKVAAGGTATFTAPSEPGTYPLTSKTEPKLHGTLTVQGV
jgi:plastocyanin